MCAKWARFFNVSLLALYTREIMSFFPCLSCGCCVPSLPQPGRTGNSITKRPLAPLCVSQWLTPRNRSFLTTATLTDCAFSHKLFSQPTRPARDSVDSSSISNLPLWKDKRQRSNVQIGRLHHWNGLAGAWKHSQIKPRIFIPEQAFVYFSLSRLTPELIRKQLSG